MRRRDFLAGVGGGTAAALWPAGVSAMASASVPPDRGVQVCVASNADPRIQQAAESITQASGHPLLRAMGATPSLADSRSLAKGDLIRLAFSHLILVGLQDDPLVAAASQREARPIDGGLYIFGYGHFRGDIGYVESHRNPFLHSSVVKQAPFETEIVAITGSTPAGVTLAANAFLNKSLVNGIVAEKGWMRPNTTLLDHDPLEPDFTLPDIAPENLGSAVRIGFTQATEDEYRGVLADIGVSPATIWRAKYFERGNWDAVGIEGSFDNYAAGLHRRAYGNTLWMARFSGTVEAAGAAPKIAAAAHLKKDGTEWKGLQPPYANATYPGEGKNAGTLTLTQKNVWVTMYAHQTRFVPGTPKGTQKESAA